MSWMRVAIGVGVVATVAGIAGMLVWINDGSNIFGVAVALASAGFLTLVACVLTRVFGSSHGSQDDAFRRGREMGYDAGFIDGRRTSRPVVVPLLHVVGGEPKLPDVDPNEELEVGNAHFKGFEHSDQLRFTPPILPVWRRQALEQVSGWDRAVTWMGARRVPLMAGVLSLVLVGVFLVGAAVAHTRLPIEALRHSPGSVSERTAPSQDGTGTPALVLRSADSRTYAALTAGTSPLIPATAGLSPVDPATAGLSPLALATAGLSPLERAQAGLSPVEPIAGTGSAAVLASAPIGLPGVAVVAPAVSYLPPAGVPSSAPVPATPSVVPVVAAPVARLTAAEQTAADALAAANLTRANAKAAADLTAANAAAAAARTAATAKAAAARTAATAKSAADLTAANAAAAAAATAQAAADAAWATAHPAS